MKVKMTSAILEAMKKAMEVKSITIPQMADIIQISRITLWRIYNGKQKTITPIVYNKLQSQYLLPYLPFSDIISFNPKPQQLNKSDYEKIITLLQSELNDRDTKNKKIKEEKVVLEIEQKKLLAKINRIKKILN